MNDVDDAYAQGLARAAVLLDEAGMSEAADLVMCELAGVVDDDEPTLPHVAPRLKGDRTR